MGITCGRVSQQMIAPGCGSRRIFSRPNFTGNSSNIRPGSANNVKHDEMEDAIMNFASATAARDAAFNEMTKTNGNLSTQLGQQEYQILSLQA